MLSALARAADVMESVDMPYDATLGSVQVFQNSGGVPPNGIPELQGDAIAWHGASSSVDGGFNAVGVTRNSLAEDTRFPRIGVNTLPSSAGLSAVPGENWRIGRGTSWHFGLEFTDEGPVAFGLMSYSQSTDARSPFFSDQSQLYSQKNYRPLLFREADIEANLLPDGQSTVTGTSLRMR